MANYILFYIAVFMLFVGGFIEGYRELFNDSESAGYTGFILMVLSIYIFILQCVIWCLKFIYMLYKYIRK